MKEFYKKLENYWQFEKADRIIFTLVKSISILIAGAYLGLILDDVRKGQPVDRNEAICFTISAIIYLILEYRNLKKEKSFPITILDHLSAVQQLDENEKKYARKDKIDEYISESISQLNTNTCPIQVVGAPNPNQICHQDIKDSLSNVLYDVINNTKVFLNCHHNSFSVGVFVKNIYNPNSIKGNLTSSPLSIVFRDDFEIEAVFPTLINPFTNISHMTFYLQTKITETLNLQNFICEHKEFEGEKYLFIFAPIPNVCTDCPPDGAIVIMSNSNENIPDDLDNILKIFGQVVSNWLSKFNDCVFTEKHTANSNQ